MGIILKPFAMLLMFFYNFFSSYGIALILFALVVKLILFPLSLKGKKSMIKMNLLSGKMQQLQKQYGKDRERYQMEVQKLYEREKVNPMGGCLWSFIPLLILLPLYVNFRYFDVAGLFQLIFGRPLNLLDTVTPFALLGITCTGLKNGLYIFMMRQYFRGLPKELEEAAYVDGSGYFRTMVQVIMPMAKPSIITVILFNFLSFWNEYIIAMTLMTGDSKTLPVGLMNLMKAQNAAAQYGQMYAGLVIVMLPTLILYILVQKKLTQGMTVGGLKG